MDLGVFLAQFFVGLYRGSFYWILAAGLTLIFGVTRILNFAHAAILVTGGYIAYTIYNLTQSFLLSLVGAALACWLLGLILEVILIRRVYGLDPLYQLLLTFGVTLVLNEVQKLVWGKSSIYIPTPDVLSNTIGLGTITITYYDLLIIIIGLILLILIHYAINMTITGLKIRAVWRDPTVSETLGLNPRTYYTLVFSIGSAMAGLGGALILPTISIGPGLGDHLIVIAFIVVVLAGLGNITGTYIIATIVGVSWSFLTLLIPELDIVILYLVTALILLVRPQGLFGEK